MRESRPLWLTRAVAVSILVLGLSRAAPAATVEEIALLKSADRQKVLVEGAKKEGKVTWYTTLIVDQVVRPVKAAFEKNIRLFNWNFSAPIRKRWRNESSMSISRKSTRLISPTARWCRPWSSARDSCSGFPRPT